MAYDAGMLYAVLSEIRNSCLNGRVEKIYQPSSDEIDLFIRNDGKTDRLSIQVGGNSPRLSLSRISKDNPTVAPMFCMLMRKHFNGAKLIDVKQIGFERVAELYFLCHDELGFEVQRIIAIEIMGKYSNLILLNEDRKIMGVLKQVDFSTSRVRQVLPGMIYELPPTQNKSNPLTIGEEEFYSLIKQEADETKLTQFLTSKFMGIASFTASEIAYRVTKNIDATMNMVDRHLFYQVFSTWFHDLIQCNFTPTLFLDSEGVPKEYTFFKVTYHCGYQAKECQTFAELLDSFYYEKERLERMHTRAADLFRLLSNAEKRLMRKLDLQRNELAESKKGDEYKKMGDLITANIYRLKRSDTVFWATDYTQDPPRDIEVQLDSRLTPSANAQRFYKKYTKAKHAVLYLTREIETAEEELQYLERVRVFLEQAESEIELNELRAELYSAGYASRMKSYSQSKSKKLSPLVFKTSGGYTVLCGRNNIQNDELTFKVATKGDLWFHAKGVPGSHVILLCNGEEPSELDYTEAAEIAAYYSKARNGTLVSVDYTRVKQIKKTSGAKPGFVIYHTNYSAYVKPRISIEKVSKT